MSKDMSTIPAVDEYEKRRARGLAAVEEAMAANTQSNADRAIKDYQDAELARVVNSMKPEQKAAPVVDENVPIIDTTLEYEPPTEEMKKFDEEKKEAQAFSDYVNSIYSQSDYEADEKRKKAAKWITAAQMLGDSIAALGNSYFAAKGANAMKVDPGAQKAAAATSQLEQDIRTAREKAAKAKLDATLKMHELKMQEKQQNIDNIIKFGNLEINKAKMLSDSNYQKQMLDLRAKELIQNGVKADQAFKISMEELGIKRDNLKLDKKELDARIDGSYYSKYGSGSGTPKPVWTPWGNAAINESMLSATNLAQLVDMAGKEDAAEMSALIAALNSDKPETVNALKQKIGRMLADASNEELYKRMKQQGILTDYGVNATTGSEEGGNNGRTVVDY